MDKLVQELKRAGVVRKGKVTLTSGKKSDFYIDLKTAFGSPAILELISLKLSKYLGKATCIAGLGHGGVPLATAMAIRSKLKLSLVRKEARKHGSKKWIDGYVPNKKDRLVIVDDVLTTGKSIKEVITKMRDTGVKIERCLVVVNRSPVKKLGFNVKYLIKAKDLM